MYKFKMSEFNSSVIKDYEVIDCPYCGGRLSYIPRAMDNKGIFKCKCGAEATGKTFEEAIFHWNNKDIKHPFFSMPTNRIEQDDILIFYLKEKNKKDEAYYKERLRRQEIICDNLRAGRSEYVDCGSHYHFKNI